jgi:hypothetical protein
MIFNIAGGCHRPDVKTRRPRYLVLTCAHEGNWTTFLIADREFVNVNVTQSLEAILRLHIPDCRSEGQLDRVLGNPCLALTRQRAHHEQETREHQQGRGESASPHEYPLSFRGTWIQGAGDYRDSAQDVRSVTG